MDCQRASLTPWTVHGILQARILEWVAIPFSLPNPGIKLRSPTLQMDSLLAKPPGKPNHQLENWKKKKVFASVLLGVESSHKRPLDSKKKKKTMFHWNYLIFKCMVSFLLENHLGDLLLLFFISFTEIHLLRLSTSTIYLLESISYRRLHLRPGMLRFMGLQRVGGDWATELNCTDTK